jgi:hypothetical protein
MPSKMLVMLPPRKQKTVVRRSEDICHENGILLLGNPGTLS